MTNPDTLEAGVKMEALLPCPFCGGPARLHEPDLSSLHWQDVYVECTACEATGEASNFHVADNDDPPPTVIAGSIAAWNRRASPPYPSGGEPVAWRYRYKVELYGDEWQEWMLVTVDPNDWEWARGWTDFEAEPLFASPPAPSEAMVVTDDMVDRAMARGFQVGLNGMRAVGPVAMREILTAALSGGGL